MDFCATVHMASLTEHVTAPPRSLSEAALTYSSTQIVRKVSKSCLLSWARVNSINFSFSGEWGLKAQNQLVFLNDEIERRCEWSKVMSNFIQDAYTHHILRNINYNEREM